MNGALAAATHPAGFWIRLVAFVIDALVIGVAQMLLQALATARMGHSSDDAMGSIGFFTFVFAVAYPTVLHTLTGQTVGKLVTRVRVVAVDAEPLPLGAALLRAVVFWVSLVLTLGVGQLIGGLRRDKRALHDLIAGSRTERLPRAATAARRPPPPTTPAPASSSPPMPPVPPLPRPPAVPSPVPPLVPRGPFQAPPVRPTPAEAEPRSTE